MSATFPRTEVGGLLYMGKNATGAPAAVRGSYGIKDATVGATAKGVVSFDIVQGMGSSEETWQATASGSAACIAVMNSTDADTKQFLTFDAAGAALDDLNLNVVGTRIGPTH